ncbi:MAG: RDD family protein [Verrucomicrobia bacterium]|nr:RDD family protein [Verrucomicrobiota bacterium]
MFIIIGGDGKEYGPVAADQVRAWIQAGRANLETKAKAVGSEEWRQLGDFAEFSTPAGPPPVIDPATPVTAMPGSAFGAAMPAVGTTLENASLGMRFGAALIDGILKSLCWLPAATGVWRAVAEDVMAGQQPSVATLTTAMSGVILKSLPFLIGLAALQCVLLSLRGQSVGKLLLGLRIVRCVDHTQAGFLHAFLLRGGIPWMIEQIPLLGGLFWLVDVCFIFGDERRCVHDYIAGTRVVNVNPAPASTAGR